MVNSGGVRGARTIESSRFMERAMGNRTHLRSLGKGGSDYLVPLSLGLLRSTAESISWSFHGPIIVT